MPGIPLRDVQEAAPHAGPVGRIGKYRAAAAVASLTPIQRSQIRALAASLGDLGSILREQDDPCCLPRYQEAPELTGSMTAARS